MTKTKSAKERALKARKGITEPTRSFYTPSPHVCAWYIKECKSYDDHREHDSAVKLAADLTFPSSNVIYLLLNTQHYDKPDVLKNILQRVDFVEFEKSLTRAIAHQGYETSSYSTLTYTSFCEKLLTKDDLKAETLKQLSSTNLINASGFTSLALQKNVNNLFLFNALALNGKGFTPSEVEEMYNFFNPEIEVAFSLLKFKEKWEPKELRATSRKFLNLLNKNQSEGLELLKGIAETWDGSIDELVELIRNLY